MEHRYYSEGGFGARVFTSGNQASKAANLDDSPRDSDGHDTHTASTTAGSLVCNADLFGNAKGTARGMTTASHVVIYKVCGKEDYTSSDILAGMDQAIVDGVDVLSLSIGSDTTPFFEDTIAISAFRATEKGIFVSCAEGWMLGDEEVMANSLRREMKLNRRVADEFDDGGVHRRCKFEKYLSFKCLINLTCLEFVLKFAP
eukprot:Gb_01328 [translate_table: standard]